MHCIFKNIGFLDNRYIKDFILLFESKLNDEERKLFEVIQKGRSTSFWDDKVYTKNRQFRLYLSTKYQKPTPLVVASYDDSVKTYSPSADAQFLTFESSLITYIDHSCSLIDVQRVVNVPGEAQLAQSEERVEGTTVSPYPELDQFVKSQLKPGGFIRAWRQQKAIEDRILYNVGGSKFCHNVKREHSSNNIYYVADMFNMTLNQYCYSCKGFKGMDIKIPIHVFDWKDQFQESFS